MSNKRDSKLKIFLEEKRKFIDSETSRLYSQLMKTIEKQILNDDDYSIMESIKASLVNLNGQSDLLIEIIKVCKERGKF